MRHVSKRHIFSFSFFSPCSAHKRQAAARPRRRPVRNLWAPGRRRQPPVCPLVFSVNFCVCFLRAKIACSLNYVSFFLTLTSLVFVFFFFFALLDWVLKSLNLSRCTYCRTNAKNYNNLAPDLIWIDIIYRRKKSSAALNWRTSLDSQIWS